MISYNAISGISTMRFTAYIAQAGERHGAPEDRNEADLSQWFPIAEVYGLTQNGLLVDGPSVMALSYYLGLLQRST